MKCPNCGLENPPSAELCDCGHQFKPGSAAAPASGKKPAAPSKSQLSGKQIGCLLAIGAAVILYLIGTYSPNPSTPSRPSSSPSSAVTKPSLPEPAGPQLELVSWHWKTEHGYAIAEGQVKNISGDRMENVEAVVTWKTAGGEFITSESSFVEYNPILPGQTSPFKVYATQNPAMQTAGIEFKHFAGGTIRHSVKQKK